MAEPLRLIGFRHSVYTWIVRLALHEFGCTAEYIEANPFADPPDPVLQKYTPFRRVPVLEHGALRLTETAAILRYLDALNPSLSLAPKDPIALAQMAQVMGLSDADVYPILIRQVFSNGYYAPVVMGEGGDAQRVAEGLVRAQPVLKVLDQIAGQGHQLNAHHLSLADIHLGPMMSYFTRVPEGQLLLDAYPALSAWWQWMQSRPSLLQTDPLGGSCP
ncbi:MAG: glutathione S-transferase family protein [Sulfitobacter sp.]